MTIAGTAPRTTAAQAARGVAVPRGPVAVPLVPDPDPDDVAAAARGDAPATARVLAAVHRLVVRYARARLGTGGVVAADDVAQDVCLSVVRVLPRYVGRGAPFMAYVYRIAANRMNDLHRATVRAPVDALSDVADRPDEPADPAPGPAMTALRRELGGELRAALERLPAGQREVLVLRVALGYTAVEVAALLGVSPGGVRVAQHRALARLRDTYALQAAGLTAPGPAR